MARELVLVHDYFLVLRGAERTFAAMAEAWPNAPIRTLLYEPRLAREALGDREIRASYLQRTGVRQTGFRRLLPLYPRAAESLAVDDFRVIVSSSSAFVHGVRPHPEAVHVCYCHSPFRYVWHERDRALAETPRRLRWITRRVLERIRRWDLEAAQRVDRFVANSELTRERVSRFWGRDSTVIHPPVDIDRFQPGTPEDYLLIVGELVPHKQPALALEAARRAGKSVKVVGTGPELASLERSFDGVAEFLGRVPDHELDGLYSRALALVVPNVEEFGIAAVEAQAAGRPVLGVDAGGTRETVLDGETGVLVPPADVDALAEAMRHVDFRGFDPLDARRQAERFSRRTFQQRLMSFVDSVSR